jgi:hypothetical protein
MITELCTVVPDMKLSPNVGSDRSWVWNAAADVSEGEPEAQTLAIRFGNSESRFWLHTMNRGIHANSDFQTPTSSRRLSSRPSRRTRRCSTSHRSREGRTWKRLGWNRGMKRVCTKQ